VYEDEQFEIADGASVICSAYPGKQMQYFSNGTTIANECKMKGILRNRSEFVTKPTLSTSYRCRMYSDDSSNSPISRISCLECVLRPCIAEFFTVFFCLLVYKFVDAELLDRHVLFYNRILTLAVIDAITLLVFVTAFQTVQISPAITLAQLFSLSTAWPLCVMLLLMQLSASVMAIAIFALLRPSADVSSIQVLSDLDDDRTRVAFRLVLVQFIGSLMVVMSQLMTSTKFGVGLTAIGRLSSSPLPIFAAVFLSSFLSLMLSTVSWNPLLAFGLALFSAAQGDYSPFIGHYVFWLGPTIGSLFGSFLFRLIFAPEESRLVHCCGCCSKTDAEHI
uniref:Uncharacterized protein n=1 Tax=Parascaris univalens TaxID=6257 RepID=A0A915C761_PARUN